MKLKVSTRPRTPETKLRRLRAIFANIRDRLGVSAGGGRLKEAVVAHHRGKIEARLAQTPANLSVAERAQQIRQYQASLLMRGKRTKRR